MTPLFSRDMGELASVKGFDLLADTLAIGNKSGVLKTFKQGLGFRYELEAAAALKRMGVTITELTKRVAVTSVDELGDVVKLKTDIDIVVKLSAGAAETMLQVKRSKDALKSLPKVEEWVNKALKSLGTTDYSRIKYVIPDNVTVPEKIAKFFADNHIDIIHIPHL